MGAWIMFWAIGLIWGSSFMLIRVGVESVHPLQVMFIRLGIAAFLMWIVVIARRRPLPKDWRTWRNAAIIGVGNNAIPFALIGFSETQIDSGLASVLQATTALFGLVIAHFAFKDERITPQKVLGLIVGFLGIIILAARNWQGSEIITGGLLGQLGMIGSSIFYASFTVFSRKMIQGKLEPIVLAATAMLSGAIAEMIFMFLGMQFLDVPPTVNSDLGTTALLAIITLGVVNTFVAYLMFYEVVSRLGASRSTMVTYVVPAVGLILGVVLLGEQLDLFIIGGAALIFAGIGIVNLRLFSRLNRIKTRPAVGD
ncbi:MAG: EamA family transporter [Anaerolineaceae bacterium]|nr:EamA family transporter [Anaerolineae bacterium]MCB9458871.1 EamA family transporter [Anaerolineaceae bacterium]